MSDLLEFSRQRLDEDEQLARAATDSPWGDAEHAVRHEPARALAEVEAKRRIVRLHRLDTLGVYDAYGHLLPGDQCAVCLVDFPCPTLLALALPYADHPDYREEWRPE